MIAQARTIAAIAWRELTALFRVPVGWLVLALYAGLWGTMFVQFVLVPGAPATMRPLFATAAWLMLPIAPAISMRLLSDELRTGSYELLATAPVGDYALALGKFLGSAMFLLALLAATTPLIGVLMLVSEPTPDPGPILAGYLSVTLLGMLFLAVGLLASTMTASQTLSFLGAMLALLVWLLATTAGRARAPDQLAQLLGMLAITDRLESFAKGVIDTADVAFFLILTGWFVAAAGMSLSVRRWL
ncbi:MAG: ABC transporter permease [Phycisphaerales bacterium]|nr:MAG: ABC transporter permease [Phycisphaerales bacterium]